MSVRLFDPADGAAEGVTGEWPCAGLTVMNEDGGVVGYGGVSVLLKRRWAFLTIRDEQLRGKPFLLHRLIVKGLALAQGDGGAIFVLLDETKPGARAWLQRLGFRELGDDEKMDDIRLAESMLGQRAWIRERI